MRRGATPTAAAPSWLPEAQGIESGKFYFIGINIPEYVVMIAKTNFIANDIHPMGVKTLRGHED
jgi:hypothetical protein